MPVGKFQIRVCNSCGLRYPQVLSETEIHRCPNCLGYTQVVLVSNLNRHRKLPPRDEDRSEVNLCGLLDNVRSISNVGSILRSAECLGLKHLYLCGITPTPDQVEVRKTALGAEQIINWSHHMDALDQVKALQAGNCKIFALETILESLPINRLDGSILDDLQDVVIVVGSEVTGIDPDILSLADQRIHIPMAGIKSSLNVSVAFAIAAYTISNAMRL